MKVITVSEKEKTVCDLLTKVGDDGLILQTTDGLRFLLFPLDEWVGFDVGNSDDFEQEVALTVQNKELMAFLAERRNRRGKRTSLAQVKEELELV